MFTKDGKDRGDFPIELDITLQPKQKLAFEKSFETPVLFYGG
jgi:hypothetical protein